MLAYLAFTRHGETRMSERYDEVVEKTEDWLLTATPKTDTERTALSVALTDYLRMNPGQGGTARDTVLATVRDNMQQIHPEKANTAWVEFLAMTVLPEGIVKPDGVPVGWEVMQRYLKQSTQTEETEIEDYFALFLLTVAKFHSGRQQWRVHNRWFSKALPQHQHMDGSFPATVAGNRTENTALAVLSLEIYYLFGPTHDIKRPKAETTTTDADIGLEIK